MNRSRPVGALGGGGWEEASQSGAANQQSTSSGSKKEKVLTEMYEMFLGSMEPDIIESVVQSCSFNAKKSLETLLEMCGGKSTATTPTNATRQLQSPVPLLSSSPAARSPNPKPLKIGQEGNKPQPLLLQPITSPLQEKKMQSPLTPLQSASKVSRGVARNSSRDLAPIPPSVLSFPYAFKKKQNSDDKMSKIRWYIEKGKRIMIIMRGCPGSGKSHLAAGLIVSYGGKPKDFVFSSDDFFMRRDEYFFVPQNLPDAHKWNQKRVLLKLREGSSPIIIDNTNTQLWEMQGYASMAINNGYAIEILEPQTPWFKNLNELSKRNKHGVPRDKIKLMLERYESDITVESLIKSTGAQYSKQPPQAAERSLNQSCGSRSENQDLVRTTNYTAGVVRRPEQAFTYGFVPQLGHQSLNQLVPKDQESSDPTHTIPKIDGFYFGSQALKPMTSTLKESNSMHKFSHAQSFKDNNASKIHQLFPQEASRLVPKTNQDFNQNVQTADTFRSPSCAATRKTDVLSGSDLEVRMEDAENQLHNQTLMPITDGNMKTELNSEESGKDIHRLIATLDCTSISLESCRNVEQPTTSKKSEVPSDARQDLSISLPQGISSEVNSSASVAERKEQPESSSCIHEESEETKKSFVLWNKSLESDESNTSDKNNSQHLSAFLKPPRSFTSKSIQDYCQSVRDINTASQSEASGWSFSENGPISWQPIDKLQEEVFQKEKSSSPPRIFDNSQRLRFKKVDVSEKSTNTHHSDFCTLSSLSSNSSINNVKVMNAYDRDINEGRSIPLSKVLLKLMLDKGTSTENDFEGVSKVEGKQEKIKELMRLFPNTSQASIKELLKQCQWDVNYVSNLLLDTDNENVIADGGLDEDSDEELEPSSQEQGHSVKKDDFSETDDSNGGSTSATEETGVVVNVQEEAKDVIRHIEQSIDFGEGCYSPHTFAIKNLRRGQREGAIPKSSYSITEAATGVSIEQPPPSTCQASTVESPVRTSESSDGNEDNETLEFIVSHDFMQQLVDKFGGQTNVTSMSPVVKFPVSLARQIYDVIFIANSSEEEEDDGDFAIKLQCEEDERMARDLYEEMLRNAHRSGPDQSAPPLREIMDMELAQAIYKADVDSLSQNSPETMAQVLAKRLLEDNYQQVDKKTLHDIFASCNFSFEDTVKTLQEALSTNKDVSTENSPALRESPPMSQAVLSSAQGRFQTRTSPETHKTDQESTQHGCQSDFEAENPWELTDPKAHHTKYRQQAEDHLKRRDEMYTKASEAFRRGQRSVAAYYAKLGELNGKNFHHANAMAAATLAADQSNSHSSDTLDLHHFKVVEAVTVFDLYIDYHIGILSDSGLQHQSLNIITGRGTHSVNGKPRIKPAILNRVKKRNLRYQPIPSNPGVIKVWVSASSSLSHEIPE